jgi:hypothetical protein
VACKPRILLAIGMFGLLPLAPSLPAAEPTTKRPAAMDLLKYQTRIRDQGGRDVCPYFPPVAALEAAYRRAGVPVELSEEHLIWLRNVTCAADKGNRDVAENLVSTLGGGNGMGVLSTYAICRAQDLPYHGNIDQAGYSLEKYDWSKPFSQYVLNRWNLDPHQLPPAARANARHSIGKYVTLPASDLRDPGKFEEILASGHEIIFTLYLHNGIHQVDSARPVWRLKPESEPIGLHFMLMVGYDSKRKFFIVKNQWGPTNYSRHTKALAPDWKDIVRYDGYTLVDYEYLAACGEAHYITEVVPVDSPRFHSQRALGQWAVTFKHKNEEIMSGVLCWRHLPTGEAGKNLNLRIGDLLTSDGQQYRVNAQLEGDGAKSYEMKLFIDLDSGAIPVDSTKGAVWAGLLELPEKGNGMLELTAVGGSSQRIGGKKASDLDMSAELVSDRNLLTGMKPRDQPKPRTKKEIADFQGIRNIFY